MSGNTPPRMGATVSRPDSRLLSAEEAGHSAFPRVIIPRDEEIGRNPEPPTLQSTRTNTTAVNNRPENPVNPRYDPSRRDDSRHPRPSTPTGPEDAETHYDEKAWRSLNISERNPSHQYQQGPGPHAYGRTAPLDNRPPLSLQRPQQMPHGSTQPNRHERELGTYPAYYTAPSNPYSNGPPRLQQPQQVLHDSTQPNRHERELGTYPVYYTAPSNPYSNGPPHDLYSDASQGQNQSDGHAK
ncbi:hypothetical protein FQN53_006005 [Emmonsiellopsis sp. PD_33]|nr:hypothetical protein FQN53_006005 [Emmonsiellopsis sp. PD_33]